MAGKPHFEDDDHALKTGYLIGYFMKAGIIHNIVRDDEGNYRPYLEIVLPSEEVGLPPSRITVQVLPGGVPGTT